jgi:RNA polymerase sigma-70 factor, ECF subfamily
LTLKTVCGLGTSEIARAFLVSDTTVAQRITRAKKHLRAPEIRFEIPDPNQLPDRLASVARVLYLMFNEAHAASDGDVLIRMDLAGEAIRLIDLVISNPRTVTPEMYALAALMQFHASRFPARVSSAGQLVILAEQDRRLWDEDRIAKGLAHLKAASQPGPLTRYHCEAGIAAAHAQAHGEEDTDWDYIIEMYETLERISPSSVISLNLAVAIGRRDGAAAGLAIAGKLADDPALQSYRLLPAVLGVFCLETGRDLEASHYFQSALEHSFSEPQRCLLRTRLAMALDRIGSSGTRPRP